MPRIEQVQYETQRHLGVRTRTEKDNETESQNLKTEKKKANII
jgi:hypothetical protein